MRALLQRVSQASVTVDETIVGRLETPGVLVLLGVTHCDSVDTAARLAGKVWGLRILAGERSASDVDAPLLVVSQFTLYADLSKGRRPSWSDAAPADHSEPVYEAFCAALRDLGATVEQGMFGAVMSVDLTNEGPMTILLELS